MRKLILKMQMAGLFLFIENGKPGEDIIPIHSPGYLFNDGFIRIGVNALYEIPLWYTNNKVYLN